ncbi:MAG: cytochrome c nitrite reductase small subunit [Ignavibacteriota bacterium]|jgi:cytochrome c nitrite reductase small subunit|nr:MAG: cytochrome c nitrite reductase small subunit [Chlorobiota bacterium]MBE7476886.1 cytochrome c nitrite reductase small subunit [Ignavibacteriales bacterium]MBL1121863.1 cytochrome c nitrite reductase small subunit [Ignavibacteriota bacterium]MBV6421451.1 Cytochrome c-type protein NrfH [Ignavibacteriaceae bacterium]MCE7857231.1 cytochrome c nitrite reductase small subunit [Ignavibacteria bacterium CHB3]MEB2297894.1 cytochrome c nitrite reductase small subunit [Ignavibacteria bacterium]
MNPITFLKAFAPPATWRFVVLVLIGIFCGLVLFTLHVGRATSYLSDKPEACVNCHVMAPYFATWQNSSHGRFTVCNDCHVPQNNIFEKYFFKASDGLRHSYMFTFRLEPQVIRIHKAGRNAVQRNCVRCHSEQIHPISVRAITAQSIQEEGQGYCWDCHRETPHGRVNSLTSTPFARTPQLSAPYPEWIKEIVK